MQLKGMKNCKDKCNFTYSFSLAVYTYVSTAHNKCIQDGIYLHDFADTIINNSIITHPCNLYLLVPHFYIVKLRFTRIYIIFFYFCSKTLIMRVIILTCTQNVCSRAKISGMH